MKKIPDEYYEDAMRLCEHGMCEEALPVLDEALRLYPDSTKLLAGRGSILSALGRYEEALVAYERDIELDGEDVIGHINRGAVLCELGRYEEALVSFALTVELASAARPHVLIQSDNQEHPGETHALMKQVEVDPIIADAYNFTGVALHELGRFEDALDAFGKALSFEPALSDTYYSFADVYYNKGKALAALKKKGQAEVAYVEALKLYNKAVEEYPEDALGYLDKADALEELGRHAEALDAYRKAKSLDPDLDVPELTG